MSVVPRVKISKTETVRVTSSCIPASSGWAGVVSLAVGDVEKDGPFCVLAYFHVRYAFTNGSMMGFHAPNSFCLRSCHVCVCRDRRPFNLVKNH